MNRRLQQFLQSENISQSQFADTLQVARASVSHILSGRNRPGYDFLESLHLHYPELSLDWLFTGRGKMLTQIRDSQETEKRGRTVAKILVFYDDNSFEEFHPTR